MYIGWLVSLFSTLTFSSQTLFPGTHKTTSLCAAPKIIILSEKLPPAAQHPVAAIDVFPNLNLPEIEACKQFLHFLAEEFVDLKKKPASATQILPGKRCDVAVINQRIVIGDKQSSDGFVVEYILFHHPFFTFTHVRRIAHHHVVMRPRSLFPTQNISLKESTIQFAKASVFASNRKRSFRNVEATDKRTGKYCFYRQCNAPTSGADIQYFC